MKDRKGSVRQNSFQAGRLSCRKNSQKQGCISKAGRDPGLLESGKEGAPPLSALSRRSSPASYLSFALYLYFPA